MTSRRNGHYLFIVYAELNGMFIINSPRDNKYLICDSKSIRVWVQLEPAALPPKTQLPCR